jgi:protein TonB
MGYQALLFCPDEKTARTVTQVLNELEFAVEACIEPFAAVKKLMGQHFDAVVVDCDNEQNATLLFKSARNSTSNQTSLAVAVVEGQAGVAKAFRIGANLVLTKPINIEQAKGTLRVARGLLRKSEPAKAGASAATPAAPVPPAPKPAPLKPISLAKPPVPPAPPAVSAPKPPEPPVAPSAPVAWPVATASSAPSAPEDDLLEISVDEPAAAAPAPSLQAARPQADKSPAPQAPVAPKPLFSASAPSATSGAASAPAPARKVEEPAPTKPEPSAAAEALFEKPVEPQLEPSPAIVGSAPSFTFGGANTETESKSSKKVFLIPAAVAVIAIAAYFGWAQLHGHSSAPAATQVATAPAPVSQAPAKSSSAPAPATTAAPAPTLSSAVNNPSSNQSDDIDSQPQEITLRSTPTSAKPPAANPSAASKTVASEENSGPAPMVVKGGKVPAAQTKAAAVDAPAPSLIGMAAPGAGAPPPNFVPSSGDAVTPVLQTLNISQGVSQGLLLKKISPTYPANAQRMRIEGTVQLLATISKTGDISHVKVLSGDSQLTRAATDAVKQWKYKPYLLNGEPVEIQTQVTINFKLPR